MNAVKIIQNLCVKLRQLLVQTDDPVSLAFAAFFLVRTSAAILALKIFLGSAVFIAPYRPAVNEMEFLSVRADWQTTFIDREIYRSVSVGNSTSSFTISSYAVSSITPFRRFGSSEV